jgi:hypothetical protein
MNLKLAASYKISETSCRGISDFKKGSQPRTSIVKDQKGDLVKDCHTIVEKQFLSAINVRGVNDIRQTEIHTAAPLVSKPSASEKLYRLRSSGI